MKSDYEMKCTCKLRSVQDSEERIKNYQLSEISPALSEILVDGKYHYPSKVSQETAVVLYPLKTDELDRVGGQSPSPLRSSSGLSPSGWEGDYQSPDYLTLHVGSTSAHPYGNPLKSVSRFLLGNCISNYQKYRKHYQKYSLMVNPLSK